VSIASRVRAAVVAAVLLASASVGYGRDGVLGALLWALACIGCAHIGRAVVAWRRARAKPPAQPDVPPELDAALRGLAHDIRSPIAAAAAAFAALEDCSGGAPADASYFRSVVRQNLQEASARLRTLEQHRLQAPREAQGPGLRVARRAAEPERR
jgi:hypothetical protein